MRKTKILIFIFSFGRGGVQKFVKNLINQLNKDKYDISIVIVRNNTKYMDDLPEEVKIIDLKADRVYFSLLPLIKTINKERADILFCIDTNINIIGIIAKSLSKSKPKLIIRQAVEINRFSTKKLSLLLTKILYPKVDACVVLSNSMKENILNYIKIPNDKIKVIYNSIDISKITKQRQEEVNDSFMNINDPKIAVVGRLTRQKNIPMLMEAFKLVLKEHKAKLILIGDGEDKDKIKEKMEELNIEDSVLMLGFKNNPYKYVYNSDVFVLSSIYEGLSNALLEALACDIPIVTTDNPDTIIKNGINGFQADINKEDIAAKIIKLLKDDPLRETIIENNKLYKETFNILNMINKYEHLFKEITK